LANAQSISLADVSPGDRVLLRGTADGAIVVISRTELARLRDADRAEWRGRGLVGRVASVDAAAREITVQVNAVPQPATLRLHVPAEAIQLRYRAGSAKFTDAVPSTLADIAAGDQIQTLADKNADGNVFTAHKIITGYFYNFAAVVTAVDLAAGTVSVRDLARNESVVVRTGPDTALRSITPDAARRLALPPQGRPTSPSKPREMEDVRSILEQLPAFELRALKTGDAVIVASAEKGNRITALTLLSGAEPLLAQSGNAPRDLLGRWNLNLDPNQP
jgi:hypothetical protein